MRSQNHLIVVLLAFFSLSAWSSDCVRRLHRIANYRELILAKKNELLGILHPSYSLESKQRASIQSALLEHGTLKTLTEQSATNLESNLSKIENALVPLEPELEEAILSIQYVFIHNTHVLKDNPEVPLLSSARLLEFDLPGGQNTFWFNRDFLKSDDQIFFTIHFRFADRAYKAGQSVYGNHAISPKKEYSETMGWISPYIMVPSDLVNFARNELPDLTKILEGEMALDPELRLNSSRTKRPLSLEFGFLDMPLQVAFVQKHPELFQKIEKELHRYDFTPQDFLKLTQALIRKKVREYNKDLSVKEWIDPISILRSKDQDQIDNLVRSAILNLFSGYSFEFKIPVAIPPNELRTQGHF